MVHHHSTGHAHEPSLLAFLSELVAERFGLSFSEERWDDLERAAGAAARELGFDDARSLINWLRVNAPDRRTTDVLASYLTVGETYFFRDSKLFHALETIVLPALIESRQSQRRLRIWCAACSTGEEPYSIAVLLRKLLPSLREWTITILATDINVRFLRRAEEGLYKEWSFRDTPAWVKASAVEYLSDGSYRVIPAVRELVTFRVLNLVDDSYPSLLTNTNAIDLILCRNVLMYFRQPQARRVVERLSRALVHDGRLIVAPAEMSHTLFPEFELVPVGEALAYRKRHGEHLIGLSEAAQGTESPVPVPELHLLNTPPASEPALQDFGEEPLNPQLVLEEARAEVARGAFHEAEEHVESLLREEPNNAEVLALRARALAGVGKLPEAEEACRRALELDKFNASLLHLHATILHELGRDDDALVALRKSLYLNPEHPISHFMLGMLYARAHQRREMERHLRSALTIVNRLHPDETLADAEGMTAGRLGQIVRSLLEDSL